jgi:hypothetical protein
MRIRVNCRTERALTIGVLLCVSAPLRGTNPYKRNGGDSFAGTTPVSATAISRILSCRVTPAWTAISLRDLAIPARLAAGATLPGVPSDHWSYFEAGGLFPCSVLHRIGFFVPPRLPSGRWALTPPFHPYPDLATRAVLFL